MTNSQRGFPVGLRDNFRDIHLDELSASLNAELRWYTSWKFTGTALVPSERINNLHFAAAAAVRLRRA